MTSEAASRIGKTLRGKYRLEESLGTGGMAEVYRARNVMAGRDVAIKMLHPEMLAHKQIVRRFLQEARAANTVRHPNIVDVLDVDKDDDGIPFIVQEYLEGTDLEAKIEGWDLTAEEVLELFIPVTEAVGLAHQSGIVHRDLKPDNVFLAMVRGEVVPKVLDFGISKLPVDDAGDVPLWKSIGSSDMRLTGAGTSMGTPLYMSPEQIRDPRGVDARTDVWSLGVMLYKALSGHVPFNGDSLPELFANINTSRPTPLEKLAPDVPLGLVRIVDRCLSPERERRYEDGSALAAALIAARDEIRQSGAPPPRKLSLDPPASDSEPPPPSEDPAAIGVLGDFFDAAGGRAVHPSAVAGAHHSLGDLAPDGSTPDRSYARSLTGVHREIERGVGRALAKKGLGGKVVVRGETAELHAGGAIVTVDLGKLVEQWNVLPPDICARRSEAVANRLRIASGGGRAPSTGGGGNVARILGAAVVVVLLVGGGFWAKRNGMFASSPEPEPRSPTTSGPMETGPARAERTCEAARRRLYAGADTGVDMAGWVVELWLARRKGKASLTDAVTAAKISDMGAKELGLKTPASPLVQPAIVVGKLDTLVVRLPEAYVAPFFSTKGREQVLNVAQQVVKATNVDHAALFARCAHLETRDVGAWYGGRDRASATVALVYAAGAYADPPAFERGDAAAEAARLGMLLTAAQGLEQDKLADELKKGGGRLDEADGGVATIRFPLGGPTRAAQVSRSLFGVLTE
jgi:serine/threonine protein kinase